MYSWAMMLRSRVGFLRKDADPSEKKATGGIHAGVALVAPGLNVNLSI
jgi:hypothetical protein